MTSSSSCSELYGNVFDEISVLSRDGAPYGGVSSSTLLQRQRELAEDQAGSRKRSQLLREQAVNCIDPDKLKPFSAASETPPGELPLPLLSVMTGELYAKSVLELCGKLQQQLRQCPASIALSLKASQVSNSRVCFAYCICYVDDNWVRREYFLACSPALALFGDDRESDTEGAGDAAGQLSRHLLTTLTTVFGLKPSEDISAVQLSCESSLCTARQVSILKKCLGETARYIGVMFTLTCVLTDLEVSFHSALNTSTNDFAISSEGGAQCKSAKHYIDKAACLAKHFASNEPAADELRALLCHDESTFPIIQHREGLRFVADCMIGLINTRACIKEYFRRTQESQNCGDMLSMVPTDDDWAQWAELVSILDPIRRFSQVLMQCADPSLSLMWLLVKWLLFIYEHKEEWETVNVLSGTKSPVKTAMLSQTSDQFRLLIIDNCRHYLVNFDELRTSDPNCFRFFCHTSLIDPRIKDFQFLNTFSIEYIEKMKKENDVNHETEEGRGSDRCVNGKQDNISEEGMREEVTQIAADYLGSAMKSELQKVQSSQGEKITAHRLHRIVDAMFAGKQNYASVLGKRAAGGSGIEITEEIKQQFVTQKMNNYADLELRQYLKLPTICSPHEVLRRTALSPSPLVFWAKCSIQYAITAHFARKLLAIQFNPFNFIKVNDICKRAHEKNYVIDENSCGLLDCVLWLSVQFSVFRQLQLQSK